MAIDVRVSLCGRSMTVPLQHDGSLADVRRRVATAFGLRAPFELIGVEGTPLTSDADAMRAVTMAAEPASGPLQLIVDATEDTLIDLDRCHEESGVMRWQLVRQLIAGLRTQIAELAAAVSETNRREARLEERLVCERSAWEGADASLRAELTSVGEVLIARVKQSSGETVAAMDEAIASLKANMEVKFADVEVRLNQQLAAHEAQVEEVKSLQQDIRSIADVRVTFGDEFLRQLNEVRTDLQSQSLRQEEEFKKTMITAAAAAAAVGDQLSSHVESCDRDGLEVKRLLDDVNVKFEAKFEKSEAIFEKHEALLGCQTDTITALKASFEQLQTLQGASSDLLTSTGSTLEQLDARVGALDASVASRLEGLGSQLREELATRVGAEEFYEVKAATGAKIASIQEALDVYAEGLKAAASERIAAEERTASVAAEAKQQLEEGFSSCTQKLEDLKSEFEARLSAEESSRAGGVAAIEAACSEVSAGLAAGLAAERSARKSAMEGLVSASDALRDSLSAELKRLCDAHAEDSRESRELARSMVERSEADLRAERDSLLSRLRSDIQETSLAGAQIIRGEFFSEVRRLEGNIIDWGKKLAVSAAQDRMQIEVQAKKASDEVRAALDAQVEFAEALEREQRLMVERLGEGLMRDDARREDLAMRVAAVEGHMQKVRGHLPILFMPSHAFA